ncbi:hypothetical protein LTR37_004539 [Vermiconidia calcicola]|uniref:Uncharacterized protein n=1 Tax=Vermiconidia calcicola TaxID=1690605 RepID=A0ACC3NND7_9PEZI|nr:hypothetical protein LTR37_004539 [Vermiconidia calcicola]
MSSLATSLGLRASGPATPIPSNAGYYLIFHFIFAYAVTSSRIPKQYYGIDHNVSPRQDLSKYGDAAVSKGKITQHQLEQLKRLEAAHANSVEHYPVFAAAMLWAHITGLDAAEINYGALSYTIARFAYAALYVFVDTPRLSQLRGLCWWASNIICLRIFWHGTKTINKL